MSVKIQKNSHSLFLIEIKAAARRGYGIARKFMTKDEIKEAEALVKKGDVRKGHTDDKQNSVCYFWNPKED